MKQATIKFSWVLYTTIVTMMICNTLVDNTPTINESILSENQTKISSELLKNTSSDISPHTNQLKQMCKKLPKQIKKSSAIKVTNRTKRFVGDSCNSVVACLVNLDLLFPTRWFVNINEFLEHALGK